MEAAREKEEEPKEQEDKNKNTFEQVNRIAADRVVQAFQNLGGAIAEARKLGIPHDKVQEIKIKDYTNLMKDREEAAAWIRVESVSSDAKRQSYESEEDFINGKLDYI